MLFWKQFDEALALIYIWITTQHFKKQFDITWFIRSIRSGKYFNYIYIYNLGKSQSQSVYNFRFAMWHIVHWNILTVDAFNFTCTTCNHLFQSPINYELTTVFISRGIFHLLFYRFVHYVWALRINFNNFNSLSLSLLLVKNISLLLRVWSL